MSIEVATAPQPEISSPAAQIVADVARSSVSHDIIARDLQ